MNENGESGRRLTQERQLALLEFIRSHNGVTATQIREVVLPYAGLSELTSDRYIVRDIKDLRRAGYPIVTDGSAYVYDRSAPLVATVSQLDLGLLKAALGAMSNSDERMFTVRNGLQKLLATSQASQASQTSVRYLQAAIPAGDCVAVVARAIQDSRVLSFQYPDGDSSGYATYEVEPVELSEHFDAFYVSGNSSKNKGAWFERTFRISRIQEGSLEAGDPFIRQPDLTASTPNNAFSVARAVVAIRPGTSAPFARRGQTCDELPGTPEGWQCYEFVNMDRNRLAECLMTYGVDVKLVGDDELVSQWRARLAHLAGLGETS